MNRNWLTCAALIWFLASTGLGQDGAHPSEYEVKAAYLYNFAKFVQWPSEALPDSATIVIGILGDDPFGAILEQTIRDKVVRGRGLKVFHAGTLDQAVDCHILFIGESEGGRLESILDRLAERSVLTVSDMDSFAEQGGMIGFEIQNKNIRFEINLLAAKVARLNVSSRLLDVAVRVYD
ncbi:MAG: YfiR family protein [bacterium]